MAELASTVGRLTALLGPSDGDPQPLDGGITNRNYRAVFGGRDYVIRFPCEESDLLSIDRETELLANRRASELGVAPAVVATLDDPPASVTRFVEGRTMTPAELRAPGMLTSVAVALRRVHGSGAKLPHVFSVPSLVQDYAATAAERGATVPGAYRPALERAKAVAAALIHAEHAPVPCHNDLLAANFIGGDDRLWIVDWEYAGMGDRYFDLGNFAANNELDEAAADALLESYFGEAPTPRRSAALALMRFMSDFREAMWGVVQGVLSELDFDFAGYAATHFARLESTAADPRFDSWLEDARG
jgi:thiamine kinase-like enzyme